MSTQKRVELQQGKEVRAERAGELHRLFLAAMQTQRNEALTLGALGLAAWGVLESQGALERYSLDLLLIGVVVTVLGPVLFRSAGTEGTRMGLESAIAIGYGAIVLALVSFLPTVFSREWLNLVGFVVAGGLVSRDVRDVTLEVHRTRLLVRPSGR